MLSEGNVRIRFRKTGKIRYISHLDLCRTLKSAFIRAGIPIRYSEGYNPRPKMVFALTVSVGSESLYELLDIGITRPMDEREFNERLSSALTADITVDAVYVPQTKFTEIAYSGYEVRTAVPMDGSVPKSVLASPMVVKKHSKKGEIEVDIRDQIREARVEDGVLKLILPASQGNFLNPEYVMKVINAATGDRYEDYRIIRTSILRDDLTVFR